MHSYPLMHQTHCISSLVARGDEADSLGRMARSSHRPFAATFSVVAGECTAAAPLLLRHLPSHFCWACDTAYHPCALALKLCCHDLPMSGPMLWRCHACCWGLQQGTLTYTHTHSQAHVYSGGGRAHSSTHTAGFSDLCSERIVVVARPCCHVVV